MVDGWREQEREGKRGRWIDHKQRGIDCCVIAKPVISWPYAVKKSSYIESVRGRVSGRKKG